MPLPDASGERAGYFFWQDRDDRRADAALGWFVTKSPEVRVGSDDDQVPHLVRAAALLRPDAGALAEGRSLCAGDTGWIAKLDTIVHELYHIDPDETGIRACRARRRQRRPRSHGPHFYEDVAEMVQAYLATGPDPALYDFSSTISPR